MMPLPTKPMTVVPALRRSLQSGSAKAGRRFGCPTGRGRFRSERSAKVGLHVPISGHAPKWGGVLDEPIRLDPIYRIGWAEYSYHPLLII